MGIQSTISLKRADAINMLVQKKMDKLNEPLKKLLEINMAMLSNEQLENSLEEEFWNYQIID